MGPHKYFLNTSHLWPKYFPILLPNLGSHKYFPYKAHKLFWALSQILPIISHILPNLGSHKYFPYKAHKLFWALSQILPIISHILPNLGSHTNTYHTTTKIGPQNYTISTKSPNSFTLWAKSKKPNKTLFTKHIFTRHPKARYYTAPLKLVAT